MSISRVCSNLSSYIPRLSDSIAASFPWGRLILALGSTTALLGLGAYSWSRHKECSVSDKLDEEVKQRISKTYTYVMGGFALTAASAALSHLSGLSLRILNAHPIVGAGLFAATLSSLLATVALPKTNQTIKHIAWAAFNFSIGVSLSPIGFLSKSIIAQAATITLGVGCSFSLLAAFAPSEKFLKFEAPFLAALTALTVATTAAWVFPQSAFAFAVDKISLYGGLALFSIALAIDNQKILKEAKTEDDFDPINSSLDLYLDNLNIFVRVLRILVEEQLKKRG